MCEGGAWLPSGVTPAGTTGLVGMMGMTDQTIVVIETGDRLPSLNMTRNGTRPTGDPRTTVVPAASVQTAGTAVDSTRAATATAAPAAGAGNTEATTTEEGKGNTGGNSMK